MPRTRYQKSGRACFDHSPDCTPGRVTKIFSLLTVLALTACASPADVQYRSELRQQRATAERLCEERGGLEVNQTIPEKMDVVTSFMDAGEYEAVSGPGDPYLGGTMQYRVMTKVSLQEMANYTSQNGVTAYGLAAHFLSTGRFGAVDLLIQDFQYADDSPRAGVLHGGRLLPDRHLPNGMYRYTLADAGNPECAAFNNMSDAIEKQGFDDTAYVPRRRFNDAVLRNGKCIAISYLGPKESYAPPGYVYHDFRNDLPDLQVRQEIDELISPDGEVIARLRNFSAGTRSGHCEGSSTNIFAPFVYR